MTWNQPLLFVPLYQTRVWGGRNLESQFGRVLPDAEQPYGESWEVSDRSEAQSVIREGSAKGLTLHHLWIQHRAAVFGEALKSHPGERYPLLMKILDACDDLSIQVHPPAAVADELNGEPKTEMWFITQAQPSSKLYAGLKAGIDKEQFEAALKSGTVAGCMHFIEPRADDCLFLPSGRVHAIGAGLVIFEIQQNSDTTYRVFDWNRTGLDGKPRALHIEESLRSMDFQDHEPSVQVPGADGELVECEYFQVRLASDDTPCLGWAGEHLTVALVSGSLQVGGSLLQAGDFALIPAEMTDSDRQVTGVSKGTRWLEVRIPAGVSSV